MFMFTFSLAFATELVLAFGLFKATHLVSLFFYRRV